MHTSTKRGAQSILERLEELEYSRVHLHGHYDHSKEMYMWPRTLNIETTGGRGSEPGAHVVTPFYCEELGKFILVNRGWVPRRKMDQSSRKQGQVLNNHCTPIIILETF